MKLRFLMVSIVLVVLVVSLSGQGSPRVTSVAPTAAKIGANVTVIGENLGKANVAGVFVSNSSDDFPATVVEQTDGKLIIKIPKVKAGDYNISIQVKTDILIQPIRLAVSE
jgi:hypothetical protein